MDEIHHEIENSQVVDDEIEYKDDFDNQELHYTDNSPLLNEKTKSDMTNLAE